MDYVGDLRTYYTMFSHSLFFLRTTIFLVKVVVFVLERYGLTKVSLDNHYLQHLIVKSKIMKK